MSDVVIDFVIDGKQVSQKEIQEVEFSRTKKVIYELISLGESIVYNGNKLTKEDIYDLNFKESKDALAQTKERLANKKILELYKEKIKQSDDFWREIAEKSPAMENLQPCIIAGQVKGITIQNFKDYFKEVHKIDNLPIPLKTNPEHYYYAEEEGIQIIAERFGMYGEPSFWKIEFYDDGFIPGEIDDDTELVMCASVKLVSDGTDTKMILMHQFKPTKDGFKMKLGFFLPEEAPAEIIDEHKYHLAVEFNNMLHYVGDFVNKI